MTGAIPWQQWMDAIMPTLERAASRPETLAAVAVVVALAALVAAWRAGRRARALERRLRSLVGAGEPPAQLEERLADLLARVERLEAANDEAGRRITELTGALAACVQHVAVVRFNAFEGMGGEQSFVLAILDGHGNGAVITTLAGREESRVFAKPIEAGSSPYLLSEEEQEAIRRALSGGVPAVGEVKKPGRWRRRPVPAEDDR
ncbi:MAG: DUF4446 family protein [Symbiobacteriaceae bacterium]|nr:MAG: DUF4446 domain-containing protein [Bacillota bacterium]